MSFDVFIANVLHPPRDLMAESSSILTKLEEFQQAGEIPEGFWNTGYSTPHYAATPFTILIGNNASESVIRFALEHGGDPSYQLDIASIPQLQGMRGLLPPAGFAALTPEVLGILIDHGFDPSVRVEVLNMGDDAVMNMYDFLINMLAKHGDRSRSHGPQQNRFDMDKIRSVIYYLYELGDRPSNKSLMTAEELGPEPEWDDDAEAYVAADGEIYHFIEDWRESRVPLSIKFRLPTVINIEHTRWTLVFPH